MRAPESGERLVLRGSLNVTPTEAPDWSESLTQSGVSENSATETVEFGARQEEIVDEIVAHNPALLASWLEFEAALQRIPQVTSLSDPQLMATIPIEEVQTRTGPQEFILGVQQRFPWFGVLDLRGQVAWEMAQEKLQRYMTELLTTVRRAQGLWWEVAYQQSARQIAYDEIALLERFADIAASRYATGVGSQQSVLKAEVEIARVQERLIMIDERISTLASTLNTLRDVRPTSSLHIPPLSEASIGTIEIDLTALIVSAETLRPEIAELQHRLNRYERERELARDKYYPTFTLGANWIGVGDRPDNPAVSPSGEGDDAYNLVFGATIPLWWRSYRAAVEEAERNIAATSDRLRDMENRIADDIYTSHFAMNEALDLMELYASSLIPLAEQTLEVTEAEFAAGKLSFLDLIDVERVLLRLRLAHEQARRDYLLAIADLERAVGAALGAPSPEDSENTLELN